MGGEAIPPEDSNIHGNNDANGDDWVEFLLTKMKNATSIDDAKARDARVLQNFEKVIHSQSSSGTSQNLKKNLQDNLMLKEKIGVVLHENIILKRDVAIQHERQKEFDNKVKEIQHMKQMVTQYQEQVRTLKVCSGKFFFGPEVDVVVTSNGVCQTELADPIHAKASVQGHLINMNDSHI